MSTSQPRRRGDLSSLVQTSPSRRRRDDVTSLDVADPPVARLVLLREERRQHSRIIVVDPCLHGILALVRRRHDRRHERVEARDQLVDRRADFHGAQRGLVRAEG